MNNTALNIILTISGLLSLAWIVLTGVKSARQRREIEREIYLDGLKKQAEENGGETQETENTDN